MGLMHKKALWVMLMSGIARFTDAQSLLLNELDGLAIDFTSDDRFGSTGFYGDVAIKDMTTPANVYNSSPTTTASSLLTYTSPSVKMVMGPQTPGSSTMVLRYPAHNLCFASNTPSSAQWEVINLTKTSTSEAGPGGTTAGLFTVSSNASNTIYFNGGGIDGSASGKRFLISVSLKRGTATFVTVELWRGAGTLGTDASAWCLIDLTTGGIVRTQSDSASFFVNATSSVAADGDFYRVTLQATGGPSVATVFAACRVVDSSSATPTFAAVNGLTFFAAKPQATRTPCDPSYLSTGSGTTARYDLPIQFTPAGVQEGLLVEEARTNLLLQTFNNYSNASWAKNNTTISDANASSPFGAATATLVTHTFTNSFVQQQVTAGTGTYTSSLYVKRGNVDHVWFSIFDSAHRPAWFNLATGTVGTVSAGVTATITALPDGWYRITNTYTTTAINPFQTWAFVASDNSTITANGNTGFAVGSQFESGAFVTSPIQTFASTVTRAADDISLSTSAFPATTTAATVFADYVVRTLLSSTQVPVNLGDATGNERGTITNNGTTHTTAVLDGGVTQCSFSGGSVVLGQTYKAALAYQSNDAASYLDGASLGTDASVTMPTPTSITVGSFHGGLFYLNGTVRKIMILPRRMSNAELVTLTS